MALALLVLLVMASLALAACVVMRTPMIRSMEQREGLGEARDQVERARALIIVQRQRTADLRSHEGALRKRQVEIDRALSAIEQDSANLPEQRYELLFEVGAPEPGLRPYEFLLLRLQRGRAADTRGIEGRLWSQQRLARVWASDSASAMAQAQARFPALQGYSVKPAPQRVAAGFDA